MQLVDGITLSPSQPGVIAVDQTGSGLYNFTIPKISVVTPISGLYNPYPGKLWRYPVIARITIATEDNNPFIFDLQAVTNQPTWTPTQAGVTQAIADISSWLTTGTGTSISLTTVGSSGPATLIGTVLNIPVYTGGSAPVYPSTLIPFGDGTTAGGVTDANLAFDTGAQTFTVGGANQNLYVNYGTLPVVLLGDFNGVGNHTYIEINDGTKEITIAAYDSTGDISYIDIQPGGDGFGLISFYTGDNGYAFGLEGALGFGIYLGVPTTGGAEYYLPTGTGITGQVITSTGAGGQAIWTTVGGSAPIYTNTLIPVGDGTTAGGVTYAALNYTTASNTLRVGTGLTSSVVSYSFISGGGTDDLGGGAGIDVSAYTGANGASYEIDITTDTTHFDWFSSNSGGASNVLITGGAQVLDSGVTVTFGGGTIVVNDSYTWNVSIGLGTGNVTSPTFTIGKTTITGSTATIAWTLPTSQGGSGTVLINNGSGVLTWSSATGTVYPDTLIPFGNGSTAGGTYTNEFTFTHQNSNVGKFDIGNVATSGRWLELFYTPDSSIPGYFETGDLDGFFNSSIFKVDDNTQTLSWNKGNVSLNNVAYVMPSTLVGTGTALTDIGGGILAWVTPSGTVTSVGLDVSSMSAFGVSGSPVTTSGTLTITAVGTTSQFIDGTGALQTYGGAPIYPSTQIPFGDGATAGGVTSGNFTWNGFALGLNPTSGDESVYIGENAGNASSNAGQGNVGIGANALQSFNSSGGVNVAIGSGTLVEDVSGNHITAIGGSIFSTNEISGANLVAIGSGWDVATDPMNNIIAIGSAAAGIPADYITQANTFYIGSTTLPITALAISAGGHYTYWNLPTAQGAANTVLTNDGSGNLIWVNPSQFTVIQDVTLTTGDTATSDGSPQLVINAAGTLLTATVDFPNAPSNGQLFSIASDQAITTLTLSSGSTILGTLTTLAINGTAGWVFDSSLSAWIKQHS